VNPDAIQTPFNHLGNHLFKRLKSKGRYLLSVKAWKIPLVFFGGALLVGPVAILLVISSDFADEWFREHVRGSTDLA
jgi:hypothetical protein